MTDLEMIKRIRAGHNKAYADLVARYQQPVFAAFLQAGLSAEEALAQTEDLLVDGYMQMGNVVKDSDVALYFYRVFVSKLRGEARNEYEKVLKLSENERICFILRQIFGFSYEEMEEKVGVSREKIAEFLQTARERLAGSTPGAEGCKIYRRMMSAYLDNEMGRAERMALEVHLEGCSECLTCFEALQAQMPEPVFEEIPTSLVDPVLTRLQEIFDEEQEIEEKPATLEEKLAKKKHLWVWLIVGSVLLFSLFGWISSLSYSGYLSQESGSGTGIPVGDVSDPDEFSLALAQEIKQADGLFVTFGMNKATMTEQAIIMMFADYIAGQPAQEYKGPVNAVSLGTITANPKLSCTITITNQHKLLVDTGDAVWELQTTRDELLDVLKVLGI